MERLGAVWNTFVRHWSSRSASSGCAGVEDHGRLAFEGVRYGEDGVRLGIEHDERPAGIDALCDFGHEFGRVGGLEGLELEGLIHESAGGVVVVDGELCACNTIVSRGEIEQREGGELVGLKQARHQNGELCRDLIASGGGFWSSGCGGGLGRRRCGFIRRESRDGQRHDREA